MINSKITALSILLILTILLTSFSACNDPSVNYEENENLWDYTETESKTEVETEESENIFESITEGSTETDDQLQNEGTDFFEIISQYIAKTSSRNILNVTFNNANLDHNGVYSENTTGINFASSPDYISVTSNEFYTISTKNL